jgi:hypothetical protein
MTRNSDHGSDNSSSGNHQGLLGFRCATTQPTGYGYGLIVVLVGLMRSLQAAPFIPIPHDEI